MRTLKQLSTALMLVLALTISAYAGVMETGETPQPPPDPSSSTSTTSNAQSSDISITETILILFQNALNSVPLP